MINEYFNKREQHHIDKPSTKLSNNSVRFQANANDERLKRGTHSSTWKLPFKGRASYISKAAIKEEFRRLDILSEQRLTFLNLKSALELREVRETDQTVRNWFREHDRGSKGYIDYYDYAAIYEEEDDVDLSSSIKISSNNSSRGFSSYDESSSSKKTAAKTDLLRQAFDRYDIDGDGYISLSDLKTSFANQGKTFNSSELNKWIETRDLSGTGKVSFDDFIQHYQ